MTQETPETPEIAVASSRHAGWWLWPGIMLGGSVFIATSVIGVPTGAFGQKFAGWAIGHFGSLTAVMGSILIALSAARSFRAIDPVKGPIRWGATLLMISMMATLDAQVFPSSGLPLTGGTLGTFVGSHLLSSFGIFGPLISVAITSLALVAWGGAPLRAGLKTGALRVGSGLLQAWRDRHVDSDDLVQETSASNEAIAEVSAPAAVESVPAPMPETPVEIGPQFQNAPLDVEALIEQKLAERDNVGKKKKSKPKPKPKIEEVEVVEAVAEPELEAAPELEPAPEPVAESVSEAEPDTELADKPAAQLSLKKKRRRKKKKKMPQVNHAPGKFTLPPLDLLESAEEEETTIEELQKINESAKALQMALKNFGLDVQVVGIQQGPVITQYELELAPGIKVSRVINLQNDIAMALKARSVRILAPIPGKSTVGVEVPNLRRTSVGLRELIEGGMEESTKMDLPSFIGRNIFGEPVTFDVSRMPHLLMAGATGAGKSVGINCLILSLLMSRSPDEVKMILVDPKQVELNFYKGIPHLVSPVVTDMKRVPGILDWAVRKMEERYDLLAKVGVRDVNGFNKLGEEKVRKALKLVPEDGDVVDTYLPRIVIVIDELADLMMLSSASKEVEANIQRLAQKSRAIGIHVVLATQRPSVDVITGVIKANLPCRVAYMVNSATDSRTILDRKGAESLLGMGDMLFKDPARSDLQRLQGAFVTETEVRQIVEHWKGQGDPRYIDDLVNPNKSDDDIDPREKDELYDKAARLVLESRRGSTTFLQRMLGVGYTRGSRLIELMEADGLVGPHRGSVSRDVLLTLEEYEERLNCDDEEYEDEDEDLQEDEVAEIDPEGDPTDDAEEPIGEDTEACEPTPQPLEN